MRACMVVAGVLLALSACGSDETPRVGEAQLPVIYGEDDRMDVYAHPDAFWREMARGSIVALVGAGQLVEDDPQDIRFRTRTLGQTRDLCPGERFADQPTVAFCSGTLVGDDLVMTAGHCLDDEDRCGNVRFVFGYLMESAEERGRVTAEDVFACREVLTQFNDGRADHAVVRLDRIVPQHRPRVPVRGEDEALAEGTPLAVIGFPSGLPMKIDTGGIVTRNRASTRDYFEASLDTFGGNSGSGVFTFDGRLAGILVRGARDYVEEGGCTRVNVLPEGTPGGDGEACTYAARAVEALCATGIDDPICGGQAQRWCAACAADGECAPADTSGGTSGGSPGGAVDLAVCAPDPMDAGARICAPRCADDADCRPDHTCDEGLCLPALRPACDGGMLVERDACGRTGALLDACEDGFCVVDACLPRAPHSLCADALDLPAETASHEDELTAAHGADTTGSCAGAGPERVYRFTLPVRSRVRFTSGGFDTVLYLRAACDDPASEIWCNDDRRPGRNLGSRIEGELDAGTYWLFLDAYNQRVDRYTLDVVVEPLEEPSNTCDACTPGEARCDEAGRAVTCVEASPGCPRATATACAEDEDCAAGVCVPQTCAAVCEEDALRCSGVRLRERCVLDQAGCGAWEEADACTAGQVCDPAEGSCRSLPGGVGDGLDDVVGGIDDVLDAVGDVEENVAAGCAGCAAGGGAGGQAWLMLIVLAAVCRRRR